ncbi:hypothetical protein MSPP1_001366 [Malassezia sp. CBS 17886]|nr:hypothetical protein MSPP1_001366 [Malassezia sp. CBS 17886]
MPRIPLRVEPYDTPAKQHRHFRCKRDQVLRALGKASYINGSQFTILWVSPRGDVETYASAALQDRLNDWFRKSGIVDEARECTRAYKAAPMQPPDTITAEDLLEDVADDMSSTGQTPGAPLMDDPFLDSWPAKMPGPSPEWSAALRKRSTPGDTSISEAEVPPHAAGRSMSATHARSHSIASASGSRAAASPALPQHTVALADKAARTAMLELRFNQLQQVMCKMIAKEWIKAVEPKKQTKWPYNKGDDGRPPWWPACVRHREPDHLMKPERHALLLAVLRSDHPGVGRLQLATAEVSALMKVGKLNYLMDVYRIGKEEERLRGDGCDEDTPVTVSLSTIEGWESVPGCTIVSPAAGTFSALRMGLDAPPVPSMGATHSKRRAVFPTQDTRQYGVPAPPWTPSSSTAESLDAGSFPRRATAPMLHTRNVAAGGVPMPSFAEPQAHPQSPFMSGNAPAYPAAQPVSAMTHPDMSQPNAPGSTLNSPFAQSHLAERVPGMPQTPSEGMHRTGIVPQGAVVHGGSAPSMKPTRSAPAQVPNTPEPWSMRHPQTHPPPLMRMDMPSPADAFQRPVDAFQRGPWHAPPSASTPYRVPSAQMQGTPGMGWSLPETPLSRHSMSMGMSGSSSHVRFSPTFDSSFSTTHSGPLTPAPHTLPPSMPPQHPSHMQAEGMPMAFNAQPPTHRGPMMVGGTPALGGAPGPPLFPGVDAKPGTHPELPFSHLHEWTRP